MAHWRAPEEILKGVNIHLLPPKELEYYHDQMHIFWKRIEEGIWFDWTFRDVYLIHKSIVIEMLKRKIEHIHPINELDNVKFVEDIDELIKIVNHIGEKS